MRKVDVRTNVPIGTAAEMADQIMRFIDERFPGVRHAPRSEQRQFGRHLIPIVHSARKAG